MLKTTQGANLRPVSEHRHTIRRKSTNLHSLYSYYMCICTSLIAASIKIGRALQSEALSVYGSRPRYRLTQIAPTSAVGQ